MHNLHTEVLWLALGHEAVPEEHAGTSRLGIEGTTVGTEHIRMSKGGRGRRVHGR